MAFWDKRYSNIYLIDHNILPNGNDFALDDFIFYECEPEDLVMRLNKAKSGDFY